MKYTTGDYLLIIFDEVGTRIKAEPHGTARGGNGCRRLELRHGGGFDTRHTVLQGTY